MSERSYRHVVRIAETDVSGELKVPWGLAEVKGIGYTLALYLCRVLKIDPGMKTGYLTDEELKRVEEALKNPREYGIPSWMLNRRKDYSTGNDVHLVSSDLIFYVKQDIEREKRIKSYRGIRHSLGLKVRGQRTRTTGRIGGTVGVRKQRR
ncbi:MAG: 30S ribosomal protein S13 [Sulfolobales archaeon]|nr:30S ribosomal protein S13 [Sulfolobales archaeon]MCX8199601.1 30S ribosomal protein S13 [Sulfolobales archaeon]MDW8170554.1 30S ribosomal protein S13 [Desulfurococcaceae archaeon]